MMPTPMVPAPMVIAGLAVLLVVVQGCAGIPAPSPMELADEADRQRIRALVAEARPPSIPDLLELTPDIASFAKAFRSFKRPLHRLKKALDKRGMAYSEVTHGAAETFISGGGNCLSLTAMYVAMAREMGLQAHFQLVGVPSVWDLHSDLVVRRLHVNARVRGWAGSEWVLDFNGVGNPAALMRRYLVTKVSDDAARALYYNNLASDALLADDLDGAVEGYAIALKLDPGQGAIWANLALALKRRQDPAGSEVAFFRAMRSRDMRILAAQGLVLLYRDLGLSEASARYRMLADRYLERHPFQHFFVAMKAEAKGDHVAAERSLRRAIALDRGQHRFYSALARVLLAGGGSRREVKSHLKQAAELTEGLPVEQIYRQKLRTLL